MAIVQAKCMALALVWLVSASTAELPGEYREWLERDAAYLISASEREEFLALRSDSERDLFIERFWSLRDPDPSTEENEARLRHYRRLKEADRKFSLDGPGWKSARGKIWIMHGPPDSVSFDVGGGRHTLSISNPTPILNQIGNPFQTRQIRVDFPAPSSEIWVYRRLNGARHVPGPVQVVFTRLDVQALHAAAREMGMTRRSSAPSYAERLARDAAISRFISRAGGHRDYEIAYAGPIRFDGLSDIYRSVFLPNAGQGLDLPSMNLALQDLEEPRGDVLQRRLRRERRLRSRVSSRVFFESFELHVGFGTVRAGEGRTTLPVVLSLGSQHAGQRLELLVELRRADGSLAASVSDAIELTADPESPQGEFLYQTRLVAQPGRYQLGVYGFLQSSSALARLERSIEFPDYSAAGLSMSDVMLFRDAVPLDGGRQPTRRPLGRPRFVGGSKPLLLKDWMLIPAVDQRFRRRDSLTAFIEVYYPSLEGERPDLDLTCRFWQGSRLVATVPEKSLNYVTASGDGDADRTAYGISIPLRTFRPGHYRLELSVIDRHNDGRSLSKQTQFVIR